jgi:predicted ArsR family transcriptional regulator
MADSTKPVERPEGARREATPAEFKAMAHPLRMRIIRLCLHEQLTNKELAERLDVDPATVLHHVRTLCATGFLEADPPRTGKRGALEKPYRSTGKSWILSVSDPHDLVTSVVANIDALRGEVLDAGPNAVVTSARLGLCLTPADAHELADRIDELVQTYAAKPPAPDGQLYGLFATVHRLTTTSPPTTNTVRTNG